MKREILNTWLARLFLILLASLLLIPFVLLFLTSAKTNAEFYDDLWALPQNALQSIRENFSAAWTEANMGVGYLNALLISGAALVVTLTLSSMVSYVIARSHTWLEKPLNRLYLLGLLLPAMLGMTPMFIMARAFGLFDTRLIVILLYGAMGIPFSVYLMTAFFRTIPHEMEEAASLDGASLWQTFSQIILPLVRPAMVTAGIFSFLDFWSDYMYGLMFLVDPKKRTVAMSILQYKSGTGIKVNWGVTTASCVIFIAPVIVLYAVFQKRLIGGLTAGSVKG